MVVVGCCTGLRWDGCGVEVGVRCGGLGGMFDNYSTVVIPHHYCYVHQRQQCPRSKSPQRARSA